MVSICVTEVLSTVVKCFFLNVSLWREGRGFGKGRGFRGRMRVGLRHCNERKTSSLLVLLSYGCMYGVGAGLRLGGKGAGLTLIHINQPKQS